MATGMTMYTKKYSTSIRDVSQLVWPVLAQVEKMHMAKDIDGLIALYRRNLDMLERLATTQRVWLPWILSGFPSSI